MFVNFRSFTTWPNTSVGWSRWFAQRMIQEKHTSVTIHLLHLLIVILLCAIYLKEKVYMTEQMAPQAAVEKITNLLISTNDSGSQDHTFLLAAYKKFHKYLEEITIIHPAWY